MDVIQILVFLTVYACFPGKTYTSEFCHDFEGMPVRPGSEYYDGNSRRICRQNDDQKQLMKFLEEKWELMFTMLDLNYDEVISEPDIEISKDSYVEVYKPLGVEETEIRNVVDDFWKCVVLEDNSLPQEISKDRFVRNYKKTYTTNKDKGFSAINKCDFYLLTMIDMNQDGFLSFGELFDDFRAWNEDNDSVVRDIFEMMGPNKNNFLPNQNYADFHAELAFGESREYYATTMDVFSSYGLYA